MSNLAGLFETIMSVFTEVGGYTVSHGGKKLAKEAGKKVGWVGEDEKSSRIATHRISGHKMSSGFGHGLTKPGENYNPKNEYSGRLKEHYETARLSGSGLNKVNHFSAGPSRKEGSLSRGAAIKRYEPRKSSSKPKSTARLKGQVTFKNIKY